MDGLGPIIAVVVVLILVCIRQINQYERGILFFTGRYVKNLNPGWHVIIPIFFSIKKVDIRTKAVDVPDQEAITKDNIPIQINAVIYYKIIDAGKAINEVENYYFAVSQLAQTTMRNIVGEFTLDQLLQSRMEISEQIMAAVDKVSMSWGVDISNVELKDISIPDSLKRTLMKTAEAEREKQAVIIQSEGEVLASENISKAASTLAATPGALHLRTLQSINDMSSDESNTTIWMIPVEALRALEGLGELVKHKKS